MTSFLRVNKKILKTVSLILLHETIYYIKLLYDKIPRKKKLLARACQSLNFQTHDRIIITSKVNNCNLKRERSHTYQILN